MRGFTFVPFFGCFKRTPQGKGFQFLGMKGMYGFCRVDYGIVRVDEIRKGFCVYGRVDVE